MKICSKCKTEKCETEFHKNKSSKDGLSLHCKVCRLEYRTEHKEKINARRREMAAKNKDAENAKRRTRYHQNIDVKREKNRLQYRKHKHKRVEYNISNRDKKREYNRKYFNDRKRTDVNFKIAINLRNRLRIAIKNNQKAGSAVNDLGCSIKEFKEYLEQQFTEGMCWDNYGFGDNKWNIDHITPLHMVDLTNREQFLKVCNYTNLRPMWQKDNFSRTYEEIELGLEGEDYGKTCTNNCGCKRQEDEGSEDTY